MRPMIAILGVLLGLLSLPAYGDTHPFGIHDMLAMDRIGDPQLSPDGETIVFVRRTTDLEANRGRTDLWAVGADGSGLRQLTTHEASEFNPRWHPDGKSVWFVSSRSGSLQIWRLPFRGGEARQVTDVPGEISSMAISPDGERLLFSADVFPDCETLDCTAQRLEEHAARKHTALVYDRLFIRHWDTWKDGRRSHLFTMPVAGGEPVDLMKRMDADCPSKPFGGPEEYAFTPDSAGIVFSARDAGREEAWSTDFDLYFVPINAEHPPRNLTEPNRAWDTGPVFSPDGKTLAYLAMKVPGYESDRLRIVLRSWPDGEPRVLTEDWDRTPRTIVFSADGKTIYNLRRQPRPAIALRRGRGVG